MLSKSTKLVNRIRLFFRFWRVGSVCRYYFLVESGSGQFQPGSANLDHGLFYIIYAGTECVNTFAVPGCTASLAVNPPVLGAYPAGTGLLIYQVQHPWLVTHLYSERTQRVQAFTYTRYSIPGWLPICTRSVPSGYRPSHIPGKHPWLVTHLYSERIQRVQAFTYTR